MSRKISIKKYQGCYNCSFFERIGNSISGYGKCKKPLKEAFTKIAGTKGATSAQIAKKLCTLKECEFLGKNILMHLLGESFDLNKQLNELDKLKQDCIKKETQNKKFFQGFICIESKPTFAEGI